MVTVRIPAPPQGLLTNLLGLLGLLIAVAAVGGLTHNWWWSALTGGVCAVAVSYVAQLNSAPVAQERGEQPTQQLRRIG